MLLEAKNLKKYFKKGRVKAVDDVSISLKKGETLGLIGESGCGKSTLSKLILRLMPLDEGEIFFEGREIGRLKEKELKVFRKKVQCVFQEPFLSLDPKFKVQEILEEPFVIAGERDFSISEILRSVELHPSLASRYPRDLSGGECQRVALARALARNPALLVLDEAVSSLDALVQMQILNLLLKLQKEKDLAYLFISHDLKVVHHMSDKILQMKDGKVSAII